MNLKSTVQPKIDNASGRYRYFSIKIYPAFKAPHEYWSTPILIPALESIQFISQKDLENCLSVLRIQYQTRHVKLAKYSGQLRLEELGIFWFILVETTSQITGKKLREDLNDLFEKLYYSEPPLQIEIKPSGGAFKYLDHANYLELQNSDWFPGFFTDETVLFKDLIMRLEVQKLLKKMVGDKNTEILLTVFDNENEKTKIQPLYLSIK